MAKRRVIGLESAEPDEPELTVEQAAMTRRRQLARARRADELMARGGKRSPPLTKQQMAQAEETTRLNQKYAYADAELRRG